MNLLLDISDDSISRFLIVTCQMITDHELYKKPQIVTTGFMSQFEDRDVGDTVKLLKSDGRPQL